jgi:hypothetical protein
LLLNGGVNPTSDPPYDRRTRRYPRLDLQAAVLLEQSGTSLVLPVRNVSRGGVLVASGGHDLRSFTIGSQHPVTIRDPDTAGIADVRIDARVVRHDVTGMALSWDHSDSAVYAVSTFLDAFYSKR